MNTDNMDLPINLSRVKKEKHSLEKSRTGVK